MTAWIVLVYAILISAGGVMGFVKAKSKASLIAGEISALLLIGAFVAMRMGEYSTGWWIALIVALLLLVRFGIAATRGFKMMPGGMVILTSVIVLAVLLANRPA